VALAFWRIVPSVQAKLLFILNSQRRAYGGSSCTPTTVGVFIIRINCCCE
jgi:hypothetical protein